MVTARDLLTGRTLGDFVVRDKLGEGGFGAVYRAEQPALQREAVIKVLHHNLRNREVVIQRFLREARLASQLDHPYAAHVYAFGAEDDGLLWIAMELVRGTPLDKLLRTQRTLSLDRLVQLMDRICEVVHTAHEQGIVHRDIKPANVIVISRAGRMLPKLLDFGIAKVADPEADANRTPTGHDSAPRISTPSLDLAHDQTREAVTEDTLRGEVPTETPQEIALTQRGSLVGSPRYMAPEQWVDPSAADARADIYALGVLAYEALTGTVPFDGRTLFEVASAHAEGDVPPVGDRWPAALDVVFRRALAKKPEERYQSALELAAALRDAAGLGGEREPLPQLDESLREALIGDAPQPIAEAVAALAAATNAHQARDAIRAVVHVTVRMIGLVALACRTRIGAAAEHDTPPVLDALHALRRRSLGDDEWLELARELCRPYATRPDAYPVPELVTMFFDRVDPGASRESPLDESLAMPAQVQQSGTSEEHMRELVTQSLPSLARLLRSVAFLADYALVVWRVDRAERWMGVRRPKRSALAIRGARLEPERPALVDREGRPVLSLWPLVQACAPAPGHPDELFLFEGKGRHGARLVALPQDFEMQDDELFAWFGDSLIDTIDEPGAAGEAAPYRGLAAFTTSEAGSFFGRERETDAVANRLRAQPLIAIVGPSGAGKSSFVQAGVIPSLPSDWQVVTVRPGPSPIAALEARLAQAGIEVDLRSPAALGDRLRARAKETETTQLLVIDQFEELFTLCQDADERTRYAEAIAGAARAAEDRVRVVLTLRDDFLLAAEQLAPLRTRLGQGLQLLATPARADLLRILTEPARRAGYDFEDRELPAQMVDAVADRPGALALLSFTASKLWELRDRHFRQLGRRPYEAMGGVGGALAQYAEETLASLTSDDQRLVREAFRHLVTADGTRAVLTRSELVQVVGGGTRADTVIERLVSARLLVATEGERAEERIEIIHEALLTAWPRLVEWRRDDAEGARLRDQLRAAARQWEERERPRGLLWRDETLTEYQLWRARHPGALTESETAFAAASLGEARRSRRLRRLLLGLAFVSLTVGLAVLYRLNEESRAQRAVAEQQSKLARANEDTARRRLVELFEEQGRLATLGNDPMRALVYLELAYREGARQPALEFLVNWSAQLLEGQVARFREATGIRVIALSRDGRLAVTGTHNGAIGVWDVATQRRRFTFSHTRSVGAISLSADDRMLISAARDGVKQWDLTTGSLIRTLAQGGDVQTMVHHESVIATGGADGTVAIWDVQTGALRHELPRHPARVRALAIAHAGDVLASADDDGTVRLSRIADGSRIASFAAHRGKILKLAFSADDRMLASTGYEDGFARVWEVPSGKRITEVKHRASEVRSAEFDREGTRLLTCAEDRTVRVSAIPSGAELLAMESDAHPLSAVFDDTGQRVLATYRDGAVRLWDARTGGPIWRFLGHSEAVWAAAYDTSGKRFITGSLDGTAAVWDASHRAHTVLRGHTGNVWSAAFNHDGSLLVTTAEDGKARIFGADGQLRRTLELAMPQAGTAAFSPDGRSIVVGGAEARVFDADTGSVRYTLDGESNVNYAAYDHAGNRIATVTEHGTLALWDARTGTLVRRISAHVSQSWVVDFSPDDQLIATSGTDGKAKIWTRDGELVRELDHNLKLVGGVAFSADGKSLVTTCDDRLARVWDLSSDKVTVFEGHRSTVSTAELSPDQRLLLTSSHDGSVHIWDVATARPLTTIGAPTPIYFSAHFSPDGRSVVITSIGSASTWHLPARAWTADEVQQLVACKVPARLHARGVAYDPCEDPIVR